jgi:hypothetical protein
MAHVGRLVTKEVETRRKNGKRCFSLEYSS